MTLSPSDRYRRNRALRSLGFSEDDIEDDSLFGLEALAARLRKLARKTYAEGETQEREELRAVTDALIFVKRELREFDEEEIAA